MAKWVNQQLKSFKSQLRRKNLPTKMRATVKKRIKMLESLR